MILKSLALSAVLLSPITVRADVTDADIASCYRAPQVNCLAEIGFDLAMNATSYPHQVFEVHLLGQIGWYDEARALSVHSQIRLGTSEEQAVSFTDLVLRDYQIIASLLAGESPGDDLGLHAISAAMQLLDQVITDASLNIRKTKDPHRLAAVRVLAEDLVSGTRNDQIMAANLLTIIGDQNGARSILNTLKDDDSRPSNLSEDMIRLIGTEETLAIYRRMGHVRPWYFRDLVRVEPDSAQKLAYLQEMLATAKANQDGERLHGTMGSVVVTAMEAGHEQMAREVVEDLTDRVWRNGSMRSLLALLRAERAIGAPERLQRKTLMRAERVFAETDFDLSLPMHAARLGEVEQAIRLFDNDPDADAQDWARLLRSEMPNSVRLALLAEAQERLSPADFAATQADLAAGLASSSRTAEENVWAREMVWQLLEEEPPFQEKNGYLYDNILEAAERLQDHALIEATLLQSARRALDSRDYRLLLQAAHQHHHMAQL